MSQNPNIVTCGTAKYSVMCNASHPLMDITEWAKRVAPFYPYDPYTQFFADGKVVDEENTDIYQQAPIVGSEFTKMEDGLWENAATMIDGKATCVIRQWKFYDFDGEYYISKAFFKMCPEDCKVCREKIRIAIEESEKNCGQCSGCCCHDCHNDCQENAEEHCHGCCSDHHHDH